MNKSITIVIWCLLPVLATSNCFTMTNASDFKVEPILESAISDLGEGPHWDSEKQLLYYVDAFDGYVHCYDPKYSLDSRINLGDLVTIVIPVESNPEHLLVSLRNKAIKLTHWKNETYDELAECSPQLEGKERFNDGKVDALGRLWIGSVLNGPDGVVKGGGALYRLDLQTKQFIKMSENFTLSNGMAWNKNNTLMYFNDSEERKTWRFDFDLQTGSLKNQQVFLDLNQMPEIFTTDEFPDGMVIDSNDNIWIAMYNGGRVVCIDSQTKKLIVSIPVPALRTSSLAFGGPELDEIYVTTGSNVNQSLVDQYPHAGKLFKITQISDKKFKGTKAYNLKV